jgi:ribosomal-protein-alanine N-acetyltransferase
MDGPSRIRQAWPADAAALALLERRCFADPWSGEAFRSLLKQREAFGVVAEMGGEIAGYGLARAVAGSGEILNVAVAPERRRQGLARAMLLSLLKGLGQRDVTEVFLEVRASNAAALALYQEHRFEPVGHRPDYYRRPREDALVLRRALEPGERFR